MRATYYHQWNTILFYKSWTCPYNMQDQALKFREKWLLSPVQIGRSFRLLHPEDRKNSLWPDCSLIEIKNTHKNSHWSDCYLLSILRNLVGKFEIHMILLSLYSIYLSTSLHLSEVSGIFDLFADLSLSKWKCYVIWHIQKNENCQDNCPSRLGGRLSCQWLLFTLWKNQYTKSVMDNVFHAF